MANIGAFSVSPPATPHTGRYYAQLAVAKSATANLINQIVAADETITRIYMGGDGYGEFTVKINGTVWGLFRNSWNERQVVFEINTELAATDVLLIEVLNCNLESATANFEATVLRF